MCYPEFPKQCHKLPNNLFWLLNQVTFHGIKIKIYFINWLVYLSLDLSLREARGSCCCCVGTEKWSGKPNWGKIDVYLLSSPPQRQSITMHKFWFFTLSPSLFNIFSCPGRRVGCGTDTL